MSPTIPPGVILTASGTRGIVGADDGLTPAFIVPLVSAYATWLRSKLGGRKPVVLVGRDTRPSGEMIAAGAMHAFLAAGCIVLDAGIVPTPAVIQAKSRTNTDAGIIISASHNPAEYNGIKFLSPDAPGTFLSTEDLDEIKVIFRDPTRVYNSPWTEPGSVSRVKILPEYIEAIKVYSEPFIAGDRMPKLIVDSGAGTANVSTIPFLKQLQCDVTAINDQMLDVAPFFPRNSEPIEENLHLLESTVVDAGADFGLAVDCDGDRISICDEKGRVLREDVGLALVIKNVLDIQGKGRKPIIVTNVASSMVFEDIANDNGGAVIRTPIGERYLAVKMHELAEEPGSTDAMAIIGGEGSCGGVMIPGINLARDATLAAGCLIGIVTTRGLPVSELVAELPDYVLEKINVSTAGQDPLRVMERLKLVHEPGTYETSISDMKFSGDGWWALIHPSNTEPVIRILAEAKTKEDAVDLLGRYEAELVAAMSENEA
jgi:phosphomannomutase/phosphoglucomutase